MASPEPAKVDGASDAEKAVEELKIDNGHKAEKSARYIQGWLLAVNITALLTSMFLVCKDLPSKSTFCRAFQLSIYLHMEGVARPRKHYPCRLSRLNQLTHRKTIVSTAIPRITHQFHSLNQVGWYGSAFFLTMTVFQATWGKVYKFFPLKTSFLVAIFVFEMGTLTCGMSLRGLEMWEGSLSQNLQQYQGIVLRS